MTALEDAYKRLSVLVIDDQQEFRTTICVMLKHLGAARIRQSADGQSGYDALVEFRPDVVLCDMHMTPIDGQAFLGMVRESDIDWVRNVPVILLSGDSYLDTVRGAMRRHADGYLVKPFMLDDLRRQLDITLTLLAQRQSSKPA